MNTLGRFGFQWITALVLTSLSASPALAEGEATFFIGGLLGGDINALERGDIVSSFTNGVVYGGRLGWAGYPFGVEGSFAYSPTGLNAVVEDDLFEVDTRVIYADVNLNVIILPTRVSPFVTAGAGLQSFDFTGEVQPIGIRLGIEKINKFGFNFGAGVKGNINRVVLRVDVRDHVTKFSEDDIAILDLIGIQFEQTVHNVEVSFGVGVRF